MATIVIVTIGLSAAVPVRADEQAEKTVEQFLARLGLTDLQIVHVERQFARVADKSREELGRRLADLYAQRLMEAADDPAVYNDIVARVDNLVLEVPQANTPALQVMMLQADFTRAENRILQWNSDRRQVGALAEATEILRQIAPQLDRHWRELAEQVETMNKEINTLGRDPGNDEKVELMEKEVLRVQAVLARAGFFAGWSNFYFGITRMEAGTDPNGHFEKGRDAFRYLLGLTEEDEYQEIKADWLGLESVERCRALIGLGYCEIGLDSLAAARICFKLLEHINTPLMIRDEAARWFVSGLLISGHLAEAIEVAAEQVETFSGGATLGKVKLCAVLIRAEYADPERSTPETRKLARLGIDGLARLREIGVLRQLMDEYKIEIDADAGFYMAWVRGQQQFDEAEKSKDKSAYESAAQTLENALKQPEASKDLLAAAQCRFTLAWTRYRLGDHEASARLFLDATPGLKEAGETQKALNAAFTAFALYHSLGKKQQRFTSRAIDAAKLLKREFPDSDEARKVDRFLADVGNVEDRIKALAAIPKDDPDYEDVQYQLTGLYYEVWSEKRHDTVKAAAAAKDVYAAVDRYLSVTKSDAANLRKLSAGLYAVRVALGSSPPDTEKATSYLTRMRSFAETLPDSNASVAELHYQQLRLARSTNDGATEKREAQWLVDHARGSAYERLALFILAPLSNEAVENAKPADRAKREQEAIRVYGRLVEMLGESPEAIKSDRNAQAANSTLARYEYAAGQFETAANRLDALLEAYPNNRDFLRRAGLATFHAKMYEASLDHWRILLRGLSGGSSGWFEAKYYQLNCLLQTDKDEAIKVYRQFKILYPTVKDAQWTAKFAQLERQFGN